MKKWIATYILFVGCIIFSSSGRANACNQEVFFKHARQSSFIKIAAFKAKKTFSKQQSNDDQRPDEFCRSLVNATGPCCSSLTPFVAVETPALFNNPGISYAVVVPKAAILKGYLLHLFPSHYFW
ncbi:MAG: hypothetical protein EOO01_13430 [Chitinophagaceae bacterium]|nr:MAG: hypothetical protein EOO01_13430 [Chitinophagaceae bacterium]